MDLKRKITLEPLGIDSWLNPGWVKEKVDPLAVDPIQSIVKSTLRVPASFGNYDKIQKLTGQGRLKEALHLLELIIQQSSEAPQHAFACLLRGCRRRKALAEGKQVHALIVKTKCHKIVFLSNLLIEMYSACGSVAEALKVFTVMAQRDVFSWTAMTSAHVKCRQYKEALTLFQQMHQAGVEPDEAVCVIALKACTNIPSLEQGRRLHSLILRRGFGSNLTVQTSLVSMYSKCGRLKDARKLFDNMTTRNVVSWNAIMAGYVQEGLGKKALELYEQMKHEGMEPDNITLVLLLKACASISAVQQGKQLYSLIVEKGLESQLIVQTALIDMYSKCGCLKDARELFDNMTERDAASWNVMIAGYAQGGLGKEALDLYEHMKNEGIEPNNITLVLVLKACASISALQQGKQLHSLILEKGLKSQPIIQTSLLDMYSKCRCLKDAREIFDGMAKRDVVSWTAMISGYAQEGLGKEALDLFEQMKHEGMEPNNVTLVLLLKACAGISALQQGKQLHSLILQKGLESQLIVQNTLIDMYSRCRCLGDARKLFDNMIEQDVVSWNAMIAGYAQEGLGKEALDLHKQMKRKDIEPNNITLVLLLKACANISGLQQGKQLHSLILQKGFESELIVQNALTDMYSKCGSLKDARELFESMTERDIVSWNTIIAGYAQEGLGKEALDLLQQMKEEGLQANDITYTCVLSACSHSGLVDEGRYVFESMPTNYGIAPS